MKNSSKIAVHLFIIQCFWSLQSHDKIEPLSCKTLYCHSLGANKEQIKEFDKQVAEPRYTFDFPDAEVPKGLNLNTAIYHTIKTFLPKKIINREKMFMGQGPDITIINQQIDSIQPNIAQGSSRGGQAIIKCQAQHNPTSIRAIILDETPSDMRDVFDRLQYTIGYKFAPTKTETDKVMKCIFPAYKVGSTPPIEDIPNIKNKDLVVILIYANKGNTFHFPALTWKNYVAFKDAGFKNVYLCPVEDGSQNATSADEKLCVGRIHSIKKHHGLAYDSQSATLTLQDLQNLQPPKEEIIKRLDADQKQNELTYNNIIEARQQYKEWNN